MRQRSLDVQVQPLKRIQVQHDRIVEHLACGVTTSKHNHLTLTAQQQKVGAVTTARRRWYRELASLSIVISMCTSNFGIRLCQSSHFNSWVDGDGRVHRSPGVRIRIENMKIIHDINSIVSTKNDDERTAANGAVAPTRRHGIALQCRFRPNH